MAPPRGPGQLSRLWRTWKSLSMPWRRRRLAGSDLSGTTFWYLRPPSSPSSLPLSAWRRIAQPPKTLKDYADIRIAPGWHQWLRYTRADPPSIEEQQADLVRQTNLRELARLADERWASKESYLSAPRSAGDIGTGSVGDEHNTLDESTSRTEVGNGDSGRQSEEDPWKANSHASAESTRGGKWYPEAWSPTAKK